MGGRAWCGRRRARTATVRRRRAREAIALIARGGGLLRLRDHRATCWRAAPRLRWVHSAAAGVGNVLRSGIADTRHRPHQLRRNRTAIPIGGVHRRRASCTSCAGSTWRSTSSGAASGARRSSSPTTRPLRELGDMRVLIVGTGGIGAGHGDAARRARRDVHRACAGGPELGRAAGLRGRGRARRAGRRARSRRRAGAGGAAHVASTSRLMTARAAGAAAARRDRGERRARRAHG